MLHVVATALRIAQAIRLGDLSACGRGFDLFMSDGECAGQEVAHIHLHVLPRFSWRWHHRQPSPASYHSRLRQRR